MSNITTSYLFDAQELTLSLLNDLSNGQTPTTQQLNRLVSYANVIGQVDSARSLQQVSSTPIFNLDDLYDELTDFLLVNFNNIPSQLQTQFLTLRADLSRDVNNHANATRDLVSQSTIALLQAMEDDTSILFGKIVDETNAIDNELSSLRSHITDSFTINVSATSQLIDNQTNQLTDQINTATGNIIQAVNSITGTGGTGGGGTTIVDLEGVENNQELFNSLFIDFMSLFADTDFTSTTTIGGGGDSGGGGTGDNPTGNAFINLENVPIFGELLQFTEAVQEFLNSTAENTDYSANDVLANPDVKFMEDLQTFIDTWSNDNFFSSLISKLAVAISFIQRIIGVSVSMNQPFLQNVETLARKTALDNIAPVTDLLELNRRGIFNDEAIAERYKQWGYSETDIGIMLQARTLQLNESYVREAWLRDEMTTEDVIINLSKLGHRAEDIPLVMKLFKNVPPTQDAITFAVREVYDEGVAQELNLDKNFNLISEKFIEILKANGIDEEFAKYYWRAHWRLPSPNQFYEMFHRLDNFQLDDLRRGLELADYAPQYIDNMIATAYQPITRVDIRRLNRIGLVVDDELVKRYEDIGYNPDDAKLLAEFTEQLNNTGEDDGASQLTRSQIIQAFKVAVLTTDEALEALEATGLSQNASQLMLNTAVSAQEADVKGDVTRDNRRRIVNELSRNYIAGFLPESFIRTAFMTVGYPTIRMEEEIGHLELERIIEIRKEENDRYFNRFMKYQLSVSEVTDLLGGQGYSSAEVSRIMQLWTVVRDDRKALPTKSEAKGFWKDGLIDDDEYMDILRGHGVIEKYVPMYLGIT